ncbi:phage late control D family protein [Stappia sp.]|uniref:phage late control D family protein n=1 Tax=Stappia sp. TaxID=1870903 RepID=UPI003A9975BC
MRDRPFIEVMVDGQPVAGVFYSRLVSATLSDATGQDADTCELTLDDAGNTLAAPREGAKLLVRFGYRDVGAWVMGLYTVERIAFEGGPQGETMTVSGRSADMRSDLKEPLSEHFDDETVGGVIQQLAARHGLQAQVSPELASEPLPYIARIDQSALDFGTRIADRFGGLFSVKGGKMVLVKRGSGSASGKALPALTIDRSQVSEWQIEGDPRPRYGATSAKWYDRKTGKVEIEKAETGQKGPDRRLRHVLSSQDEAKTAASAEGERLSRATGSGSLTLAGLPEAQAEADVVLTGFRAEINGRWRAASVEHRFDSTYTTTIELEAPEGGKKD